MAYLSLSDGEAPPTFRLTALGAAAFLSEPAHELGFVVDLVGVENRPPSLEHAGQAATEERRYLLSPGQVAELVVELLTAGKQGGPAMERELLVALEALK